MVIVEGPDGAGKTTLVERIAERFSLPLGKRSTSDRDRLHEHTVIDSYHAVSEEIIGRAEGDPPVVWDRMFYSDPIYANIVRDEPSMFSNDQLRYLHAMVVALGCPFILCLPPRETVRNNVNAEGHQLSGVRERIDDIYAAYTQVADTFPHGHPFYVYDYTVRGSAGRQLSHVQEYINRRRATCRIV